MNVSRMLRVFLLACLGLYAVVLQASSDVRVVGLFSDRAVVIIDGQQRTISVCQYVEGDFSVAINGHQLAFHNLQIDQQEQILDYELMVYLCEGTDSEKLEWFKTINIAGEELTNQETTTETYQIYVSLPLKKAAIAAREQRSS